VKGILNVVPRGALRLLVRLSETADLYGVDFPSDLGADKVGGLVVGTKFGPCRFGARGFAVCVQDCLSRRRNGNPQYTVNEGRRRIEVRNTLGGSPLHAKDSEGGIHDRCEETGS